MSPVDLLYLVLIGFIRTVKWIEFQILKIFSKWIIAKAIEMCEEIGVKFHFSDDGYKNWNELDEKTALAKCHKYDSLIHIRLHEPMYFVHLANSGSWGAGEAYVNGMWDFCKDQKDMAEYCKRVMETNMFDLYYNWWNRMWSYLEFDLFNLQTRSRAMEVITKHYDLGNDIYEATLDPYMQYTCGYWAKADNLNDAQLDKLELIAQKLQLKPGMRVLDIGCGWGMLCKYLAERHGVQCVGVTISKEGADYSRKACQGLPVEIRMQDYRDIKDSFDRIVVVGMIEHVGFKNYREFFKVVNRNLKDDGIFLLHTIGVNHINIPRCERWICTYIFANGCLPRPGDLVKAAQGLFVLEDWHNFGLDYSKTLAGWQTNFNENWSSLKGNYGEKFYRMWVYYLVMCEGMFLARKLQLWQIVLTKGTLGVTYRSPR